MNHVLTSILEKQVVRTPEGVEERLHSSIDKDEAVFLQKLIREYNVKKSLEVGCAMGVSSLAICEVLLQNGSDTHHTIIDPFQGIDWKNFGISNLEQAGFSNFTLVEEGSEFALPRLAKTNSEFDFAFIDGWHTFDHTLVDFFYINRLLKKGGVLVIDDVQMPSVNKVMRMIHTFPAYRLIGSVSIPSTKGKRTINAVQSVFRPLALLMGKRLAQSIWSSDILFSDQSLGLNSSVVAFEKISEDKRPWNWFENF